MGGRSHCEKRLLTTWGGARPQLSDSWHHCQALQTTNVEARTFLTNRQIRSTAKLETRIEHADLLLQGREQIQARFAGDGSIYLRGAGFRGISFKSQRPLTVW